ncbi:MAG: cytochrome c [Chloroflexi bacterium]|nr:cytochrome c [Chloroflexota bacterium]
MGYEGPFGFGREATKEEIDAWNIDVGPDGKGAPQQGRGTPVQGAPIFLNKCSSCHGAMGEGEEGFPTLVKPFDRSDLKFPQFPRTIGNYWPYATTVFDYVRRAMPFSAPNSLTPEEVYALTAWLLNKNGIIGDNDSIDAETLPKVQMPARKFFRPVWPQFFRP